MTSKGHVTTEVSIKFQGATCSDPDTKAEHLLDTHIDELGDHKAEDHQSIDRLASMMYAMVWSGGNTCKKLKGFMRHFHFLSFADPCQESSWQGSISGGKMVLVRIGCIAKILLHIFLLVGGFVFVQIGGVATVNDTTAQCVQHMSWIGNSVGLFIQFLCFGVTFNKAIQRRWQYLSALFIGMSIVVCDVCHFSLFVTLLGAFVGVVF